MAGDADHDEELDSRVQSSTSELSQKIRWIHFQLGCAVLLPWNLMITATPFFLSRLEGSHLQAPFPSALSSSFTFFNFIFLAWTTITAKSASSSRRIFTSTIWLAILALLLTVFTFVHFDAGLFFGLVIFIGVCQAFGGSYLQTSVVAVAALFGPAAVQSVMAGQAAVAVAVSLVQVGSSIISVWGMTPDQIRLYVAGQGNSEANAAIIFFALSTVFLLSTTISYAYLTRTPSFRRVMAKDVVDDATSQERQGLVAPSEVPVKTEKNQLWRVAKANASYELAVALVFIVTLAVFPPITATITPVDPRTHPLLFSSVHFLVFNLGDLWGRQLCSIPRLLIWNPEKVLVLSIARVLFIPLFLLCNVPGKASPLPDWIYMFILLVFGVTNGWLSSLCMMGAPSLEHNPRLHGRREDVSIAAALATFFLAGGLVLGSAASFGVQAIICKCNPFLGL